MYDQRRRGKHYRARSVHVVRSQPWSTKMLVHGSRTRGFIHTEIKIYIDRSRCVSLSIHVLDYMYQHVCICSRPTCKGPCANVQKIDRGTRSLAYSKSSCQHAVYTYEYVYICVQCVCDKPHTPANRRQLQPLPTAHRATSLVLRCRHFQIRGIPVLYI